MSRRPPPAGQALWLLAALLWLLAAVAGGRALAAAPPATAAQAAPAPALRLSADAPRFSLEGRLEHLSDPSRTLDIGSVQAMPFVRLADFRSLGYGTDAHWFRFTLQRAADAPSRWVLAIGSPELEQVDVYVERPAGGFQQYALGYHRPYVERPIQTRLLALPIDVATDAAAGTRVYLRVRTTNAINVYADVWQVAAFTANETRTNFHHGLYFGILLIAVVLYAVLGARLRDITMLAYAGYIVSQALFHLGTSGYLPVLLPAAQEAWGTDVLPRLGWLGGAASIVLMWDHLMALKRTHPRIHLLHRFTIVFNLALLPFALMPTLVTKEVLVAVKLANYLNVANFVISMSLLLHFWRRSRQTEWMIYFTAFIIPAVATLINTATNHGAFSLNIVTSNLYQLAPLVHVLVMSYGLALRLRQLQHDKVAAEQEAALAARRGEEQRRFVAMLSHEFRNPLAAIDRAAQMIQLRLPHLAEPETRRLAQIRANAETLAGFVDSFLMTEALDHGALALARQPCAISALLDAAIRQQGETLAPRIRIAGNPGDAVFELDPTLIGVALGNLLANALRYSPADSTVTLSVRLNSRALSIRVADEGPGLGADDLARLGTPYFRAASSLGQKGSGLGYHFTRRIVEAHGGTLRARSAAGRGLTVSIRLPLP